MNIFEIAAIGLQQDTQRLRVHSHNAANVTTPGYKRQIPVQAAFADAVQAELGAQSVLDVHADMSAGKLRPSANPLDVALGEREFLLVQTSAGTPALSSGAGLQIDARGRLLTSGGLAVQGAQGDVLLPGGAAHLRIDAGGQVYADDRQVGALRVMRVGADVPMSPLGAGLYALPAASDVQAVVTPRLQPGHTEASNVAPSQEMVQVMATMRHAESMVRMLQGADEMLEKTIRKLGEV